MANVCKGFVDVPHGQVHFRYGGSGPVVVLLHDSPRSSVLHIPTIEWLGEYFTVIALDTPGYGNSSPLPDPQPSIEDFSRALAATLTALGIERCALYGFHTSSKIALQFAVDHPERAALTILDGLSLPDALPDEEFLHRYLLPFVPSSDGEHLARHWTRILDFHRFFPWFSRRAESRIAMDLPDDRRLHEYATDVLMAGRHWTGAYGAALRYAALPWIERLRSRTVFLCREDDVLYSHLDRLPATLPPGCGVERVAPGLLPWRAALRQHLHDAKLPDLAWQPPRAFIQPRDSRERCEYVDQLHGQIHVRRRDVVTENALPVLLLHDAPGSSRSNSDLAARLGKNRTVIAPDLPGLGESDPLPSPTLGAYVSVLDEMLVDGLRVGRVDVVAEGLGTCFALGLAANRPDRVRRLVVDGVPMIRSKERRRIVREYCPYVEPDRFGMHLQRLWHQLRDAQFSWPWFDRSAAARRVHDVELDAETMHGVLVDVIKQIASYGDAARAALDASVRDIAKSVEQPTLVVRDERDVRYQRTGALRRRLAQPTVIARPAALDDRVAAYEQFLSG